VGLIETKPAALAHLGEVWRESFAIKSWETDARRRTPAPHLFRLMQETAWRHAEWLRMGTSDFTRQGLGWILSRALFQAAEYPRWRQTVHVHTWMTAREKLLFHRDFWLCLPDGTEVARASSVWFAIDAARRRPRRTADYSSHLEVPEYPTITGRRPARLETPAAAEPAARFRVRYHDLDSNGHLTSTRYLDFLLDAFPAELQRRCSPRELTINYQAEALLGEELAVVLEDLGEGRHRCALKKQAPANTEACLVELEWG